MIARALVDRIIHAAKYDQDFQVIHILLAQKLSRVLIFFFRLSLSSLKFRVFLVISRMIRPLELSWVLNTVLSTVVDIVFMRKFVKLDLIRTFHGTVNTSD